MKVFMDTGAWFALAVPNDPNHRSVSNWLASNTHQILTTDYCADETLTLLCARGEHRRALDVGREFFEKGDVELKFVSPDQIRRAWILFAQRAAAGWSFTDCTSKIVIDDLHITTAVALDQHFTQFGITVVP